MIGTRLVKSNTPKYLLWVYFGQVMGYLVMSILLGVAKHYTEKHSSFFKFAYTDCLLKNFFN